MHAENEALRWLADLAGLPAGAGGCFVQGGTNGNLSALHAAREHARHRRGGAAPERWRVACSEEVHSSVRAAARFMDVDVLPVAADEHGRMHGEALRAALAGADGVFAAVATAGTTNAGLLDDLAGHRRGLPRARRLAARRRRLRRGRPVRAEHPRPLRRDRARRLADRRPAQVAVRAVRLVRAAVPRAGARPRRAPPERLLPRRALPRRGGLQPVRLRAAPHAPRARDPVLVLARRARHRRLRGGGRAHARGHARGRGGDPRPRGARAGRRAGAVDPRLPPPRLGRGRTTTAGRPGCARPAPRSCSRRPCAARPWRGWRS